MGNLKETQDLQAIWVMIAAVDLEWRHIERYGRRRGGRYRRAAVQVETRTVALMAKPVGYRTPPVPLGMFDECREVVRFTLLQVL